MLQLSRISPRLLTVAILIAIAPPIAANPLRQQIDAIVEPYWQARDFQGVVAVQREGEDALFLPYGQASVELAVEHNADGIFRIGSVSKQLTAAAILLLEEGGRLSTEDPVSRHLPGFGHGEVTLEQLLTHTAGVADIYSLERFGRSAGRVGDFDEVLADLGVASLTHEPGTVFAYSNGGYAVLAAVVERVSGLTYGDFLRRRIFEPLGMTHTAVDRPGPAVTHRVEGYDPWGTRELESSIPVAPAFTKGSGSLWSSAQDLLTWTTALHGGRVLSPASYEKMTTDRGRAYGYGVSVFQRFGRRTVGHDGRVNGFACDLAHYLDDGVTIAVLSNVQSAARDEIRRLLAAAVFGEDYEIPARRTFEPASGEDLASLAGVYSFGPGFEVSVRDEDGRLLARANQGGSSELVFQGDGKWFSRMLYATVRFGVDDEGTVDRLIWGSGDGAPVGRRTR